MAQRNEFFTPILPVTELLPLRILVVSLQFIAPTRSRFFHQAEITGFLRYLLDHPKDFEQLLILDTPESGRIEYAEGDFYRFSVIALSGAEALLQQLIGRLNQLPYSARNTDLALVFRDNCRLAGLHDAFSEASISSVEALSEYNWDSLQEEARQWSTYSSVYWHWLCPVRLLKSKQQNTKKLKGEARFCRDAGDVDADLLLSRVFDTQADLLRRRGVSHISPRPKPPELTLRKQHLFWVDSEYSNASGNEQVMGGMLGYWGWEIPAHLDTSWWLIIVLGQYLGTGQRRSFGWGRYELVTDQGGVTYRRALPATPMLDKVITDENLLAAYRHVQKKQTKTASKLTESDEDDFSSAGEWQSATHDTVDDWVEDDLALEKLQRLSQKLVNNEYQVPTLNAFYKTKPDGSQRMLTVSPFWDRVLQRAVSQILTPALEEIMYGRSHGYRPGRSRITAKEAIQRAWREGYHWVFESDVEDFFPSVNLQRLAERLAALFYDDSIVEHIIAWLAAPIELKGEPVNYSGLPQGSPLSPLMANLLLDDFDSDMQTAGFRLIRFADDFIVMCKSPEEAQRAAARAQTSLEEHGLALKPGKTRVRETKQGFKYLGYLFVNDMALDVGGQQQAVSSSVLENPGWVTQLSQRPCKHINAEVDLPNVLTPTHEKNQWHIGERQSAGTFLCITGKTAYISTQNGRLHGERENECIADLPWRGLQAVLLIGPHNITTPALRAALKHDIPVHFASSQGYYQGATWGGKPGAWGSALWQLQQQRAQDFESALHIAKQLTQARIEQQIETLRQRNINEYKTLKNRLNAVTQANTLTELNGVEGQAAKQYFAALADFIPDDWEFMGRLRRPPPDPFNLLLSLGYSVLYAHADTVLRVDGLLPWQGFYHQPHGRHAALASDLMEPFRHIVERVALTHVSRRSLTPDDFTLNEEGGCTITADAKRRYLASLLTRFETETQSKGCETKETLYQQLHRQNLSLIGWLQGEAAFTPWRNR